MFGRVRGLFHAVGSVRLCGAVVLLNQRVSVTPTTIAHLLISCHNTLGMGRCGWAGLWRLYAKYQFRSCCAHSFYSGWISRIGLSRSSHRKATMLPFRQSSATRHTQTRQNVMLPSPSTLCLPSSPFHPTSLRSSLPASRTRRPSQQPSSFPSSCSIATP